MSLRICSTIQLLSVSEFEAIAAKYNRLLHQIATSSRKVCTSAFIIQLKGLENQNEKPKIDSRYKKLTRNSAQFTEDIL